MFTFEYRFLPHDTLASLVNPPSEDEDYTVTNERAVEFVLSRDIARTIADPVRWSDAHRNELCGTHVITEDMLHPDVRTATEATVLVVMMYDVYPNPGTLEQSLKDDVFLHQAGHTIVHASEFDGQWRSYTFVVGSRDYETNWHVEIRVAKTPEWFERPSATNEARLRRVFHDSIRRADKQCVEFVDAQNEYRSENEALDLFVRFAFGTLPAQALVAQVPIEVEPSFVRERVQVFLKTFGFETESTFVDAVRRRYDPSMRIRGGDPESFAEESDRLGSVMVHALLLADQGMYVLDYAIARREDGRDERFMTEITGATTMAADCEDQQRWVFALLMRCTQWLATDDPRLRDDPFMTAVCTLATLLDPISMVGFANAASVEQSAATTGHHLSDLASVQTGARAVGSRRRPLERKHRHRDASSTGMFVGHCTAVVRWKTVASVPRPITEVLDACVEGTKHTITSITTGAPAGTLALPLESVRPKRSVLSTLLSNSSVAHQQRAADLLRSVKGAALGFNCEGTGFQCAVLRGPIANGCTVAADRCSARWSSLMDDVQSVRQNREEFGESQIDRLRVTVTTTATVLSNLRTMLPLHATKRVVYDSSDPTFNDQTTNFSLAFEWAVVLDAKGLPVPATLHTRDENGELALATNFRNTLTGDSLTAMRLDGPLLRRAVDLAEFVHPILVRPATPLRHQDADPKLEATVRDAMGKFVARLRNDARGIRNMAHVQSSPASNFVTLVAMPSPVVWQLASDNQPSINVRSAAKATIADVLMRNVVDVLDARLVKSVRHGGLATLVSVRVFTGSSIPRALPEKKTKTITTSAGRILATVLQSPSMV